MNFHIELPECKSIAIRALVIHYVATGEVLPIGEESCSDVRVTAKALAVVRDHADADGEREGGDDHEAPVEGIVAPAQGQRLSGAPGLVVQEQRAGAEGLFHRSV